MAAPTRPRASTTGIDTDTARHAPVVPTAVPVPPTRAPGIGNGRSGPPSVDDGTTLVRPHFTWVLGGFAAAIFILFTTDQLGYLRGLGWGSLFEPGLIAVGAVSVVSSLWLKPAERTQLSLAGIIALIVTVPINRVEGINRAGLILFIGVCALLALVGFVSSSSRFSRSTLLLLTAMLITMAVSTALAGSASGFLKFALAMVPAVSAFLLAGRLDHTGRRNVALVVVVMAVIEALVAIPEPFLYPRQLWVISDTAAVVYPSNNIIAGLMRSQGTLGHPLPLGFLLMIGLALVLRVLEPRAAIKWPLVAILMTAVLMTGSRNSLILGVVLVLFYPGKKLTAVRLIWSGIAAAILVIAGVLTGQLSFSFVDEFAASGSYTHRAAAFDAFGQLMTRQSLLHTVIGNGFGGIQSLFSAGLLQTDGFDVVDNEFVAQLGQAGLIGLVALAVLTIRPLFAKDWHWRGATLVVLANCMIYDWLSWPNSATIALFVLGCAYAQVDTQASQAATIAPVFAGRDGHANLSGHGRHVRHRPRTLPAGVTPKPLPLPSKPSPL